MKNGISAPEDLKLSGNTLFRGMSRDELDALFAHVEPVHLKRGGTLIRQGSAADELYFVTSGRFSVRIGGEDIAEIGTGMPVGEIAFFTGSQRTADVVAIRDSSVLMLDREGYAKAITTAPGLQNTIIQSLAERLAETSQRVGRESRLPQWRTIALLPLSGVPLDLSFIKDLEAACRRHATVLTVDAASMDELLPDREIGNSEMTCWLNDREQDHDLILYIADAELTPWSELCLRQADQIIGVAPSSADRQITPLEQSAYAVHPPSHRRLVLLHPQTREWTSDTAHWLDNRDVFMHHHVCASNPNDVARLARFLTGNAVGFVGGGGGAFGSAHIGVFRACQDAGVRFDIFGGSSVGAAMTAAFTFDMPTDEMDRHVGEIFVTSRALSRPTIPKYGLLDHTYLDDQFRKHYTENDIEDLWLPYFAVATNLSNNTQKVIRSGKLWRAIRASSAIPGILPPVFTDDGEMLVDGGIADNLPFRTMHALKNGPNLIVCFARPEPRKFDVDYDSLPGRAAIVKTLINPFKGKLPRAPGIGNVIMRSFLANQNYQNLPLKETDLLVRPPLIKGVGFMNWRRHTDIYLGAKAFMSDRIDELRASGNPAFAALDHDNTQPQDTAGSG